MAYQVLGTQERIYRVRTPAELTAWVDDEIAAMADGWVPLASEIAADDSLRVIYGKLPTELDREDAPHPGVQAVPLRRDFRPVIARALASIVVLCVIALGVLAALGLPATPV